MNPARFASPAGTVLRAALILALLLGWSIAAGPDARAGEARAGAVVVRGGNTLYSASGARCTVGFNARSGSTLYALVSGWCVGSVGSTWYADSTLTTAVGVTAGMSFPGNDYAVIRYTNTTVSYPGEISLGGGGVQDITAAASPAVGQQICHVGRTSGYRCGTVQAVNVTVNYGGGVVSGLFRSNLCSEPGDMGGPAFSGGTALGIIVGGSGNCASGGVTYYQPVVEILAVYGLSIY
ncbi:S1 family peptidase [Streptomyces fumanus]|uniref:S1 family peptidase n=1 Tax=Streptomyces fumanus TaxID=67302 RepID=UPI001E476DC1|nr:S1 family peptidase [Streptomyces fumanus]